jgi:glycerol-3-phosphate O-acyltransferase
VLESGARNAPAAAKSRLVQALANRIAYGISRAVTITPVGLVAATLLSHVRRGLGVADVARRVELLRYIAAEGGARFARDLAGAPSDPREPGPIADAIRRLERGGLVRIEIAAGDTIYQVVDEKRPVLDYHRNAVIHRYVAPALVSAALRSAGPDGAPRAAVRERALFLSRLLKLEFIYRVGATFDEIFEQNVEFLERVGALARDGERLRAGPEPWRRAGGRVDRKALVRETLERGRAAFLSGGIALRESLSKATLENAVEWLVSQRALVEDAGALSVRDGGTGLRAVVDGIAPLLAS